MVIDKNKQVDNRMKSVERYFPNHDIGPVYMQDGDGPLPEWVNKRVQAGTIIVICDDIDLNSEIYQKHLELKAQLEKEDEARRQKLDKLTKDH